MENDLEKRDKAIDIIMKVKANLYTMSCLMGEEKKDSYTENLQLSLGDMADRLDKSIDIIGEIGVQD